MRYLQNKVDNSRSGAVLIYRPPAPRKRRLNMLTLLARNWWMTALRGLVAVLFGLAALFVPDITLETLVFLFGAYVLLDGVLAIAAATANRVGERRWWVLLEGLSGVVVGVATFVWPSVTEFVLLYLIAAWAIVTGMFEILAAIELRQEIEGEWFVALSGLGSLIFGTLVALQPQAGALAIAWLMGIYAIFFGVLLLMLAFRLREVNKQMDSRIAPGL